MTYLLNLIKNERKRMKEKEWKRKNEREIENKIIKEKNNIPTEVNTVGTNILINNKRKLIFSILLK